MTKLIENRRALTRYDFKTDPVAGACVEGQFDCGKSPGRRIARQHFQMALGAGGGDRQHLTPPLEFLETATSGEADHPKRLWSTLTAGHHQRPSFRPHFPRLNHRETVRTSYNDGFRGIP